MFSRPKDNVYSSRSAAAGWKLTTLSLLAIVVVFLVALLLAYYLGLRAGKTSGLELAHENSLAQVMRMPVSKAVFDRLAEDRAKDASADIYQELAKTKQENKPSRQTIEEVSKEVKEVLKPTATASALQKQQPIVEPEATAIAQIVKGKQENVDAIRQALEQVNPQNQPIVLDPQIPDSKDSSVRVINPVAEDPKAAITKQQQLNQKENFTLEEEPEDLVKPQPTPKIKPTVKITPTASVKKTPVATPTSAVSAVVARKLLPGWYSQVAAPKSLKEAQSLTASLKKAGLRAQIESAEVGDQQYFRVVVGPDTSRLAAEQNLSRLRKQPSLRAEPFVRLVR